jgi:hypothetical protein
MAIALAVKAHVTYQAIADEFGISRQRVQQMFPGVLAENAIHVGRPSASFAISAAGAVPSLAEQNNNPAPGSGGGIIARDDWCYDHNR